MKPPDKYDFGLVGKGPHCRDLESAWDHLHGLSKKGFVDRFEDEESIDLVWGLSWIGKRAFTFYFEAAVDYVFDQRSIGDEEVLTNLASVLELRIEQSEVEQAALECAVRLIDYVSANLGKFFPDDGVWRPVTRGELELSYSKLRDRVRQSLRVD